MTQATCKSKHPKACCSLIGNKNIMDRCPRICKVVVVIHHFLETTCPKAQGYLVTFQEARNVEYYFWRPFAWQIHFPPLINHHPLKLFLRVLFSFYHFYWLKSIKLCTKISRLVTCICIQILLHTPFSQSLYVPSE